LGFGDGGSRFEAHGQGTGGTGSILRSDEQRSLDKTKATTEVDVIGRGERVTRGGDAGDVASGFFTQGIIQGHRDGSRGRSGQQKREGIEEGIEEPVRMPTAAREDPIFRAPIKELTAQRAQGGGGQVRRTTGEQAETEAVGALEGSPLREGGAPGLEQRVEGLKKMVHGGWHEVKKVHGSRSVEPEGLKDRGRCVWGNGPELGQSHPCGHAPE
jgi:hypothetical protein